MPELLRNYSEIMPELPAIYYMKLLRILLRNYAKISTRFIAGLLENYVGIIVERCVRNVEKIPGIAPD